VIALTFLAFLSLFAVIGMLSYRQSKPNRRNYLLADQNVKPWLVALSAVATNNSGYMFIGVIGYTYVTGLPATWLMVGWIVGDIIASQFIHRRLREATTRSVGDTFPGVLSRWHGNDFAVVRHLGGIVTVIFLGTYAAAQLTAGSKALHVLFGWPQQVGALIGAGIVLMYCLAGGIRASIWTDAAQSIVMIVAMLVMLVAGIDALGGVSSAWQQLDGVSPTFMKLLPADLTLGSVYGPLLFIVGWLFAGFSVVGQPHIMVRFMALDNPAHTNRARLYYYLWFVAFYFLANAVALLSRVLLPESANFDPELALPMVALQLLHPVGVGLVLAGIFAATMSTADSLILSCAGSLAENFVRLPYSVWVAKGSTVLVTGFALWLALSSSHSVFELVISSWAVLAACFGPLVAVLALGQRPNQGLAVAMMVTGILGVYVWTRFDFLGAYYEGTLAICAGFLVFAMGKFLGLINVDEGLADVAGTTGR